MTQQEHESWPSADHRNHEVVHEVQGAMIWQADAWGLQCSLLSASPSTLGFTAEEVEAERGFLRKHVHPDDWGALADTLYRAAEAEGVHTCQHRLQRRDGSMLWAQTSVHRSGSNGSVMLTGVTVDLTQVMEQERVSRDAAERAQLLIENLREYAVFMMNPDATVASWNTGAHNLHGYTEQEIIGEHLTRFFPQSEIERGTPSHLVEQAKREHETQHTGWLVRKDGTQFWACVTIGAVLDQRGELRGFSIVAQDRTQQKLAEERLRQSETMFRLMVDSVQEYAVFQVSLEGHVESWNRGAQRFSGYRSHEIMNHPIEGCWPREERDKGTPRRLMQQAESQGTATYEGPLLRKDGSRFWASFTLSAVEDADGRLRGFSTVARDLTERKRTEDAMRASEERLRLLIESLLDYAVFMVSRDAHVRSWSSGAEKIHGYKASEIVGASIAHLFPPEEIETGVLDRLMERAAEEGRAEYEGWMVRASGARFWASVILSSMKDANGELWGYSSVARDLTERIRAERVQAFLAEVGSVLARSRDQHETCDAICRLATRELAHACILVIRRNDELDPVAVAHAEPETEDKLRGAVRRVPFQPWLDHGISGVLQTGQSELASDGNPWTPEALGFIDVAVLRPLGTRSYVCAPLIVRGKTLGALVLLAPPDVRYGAHELRVAEELASRGALAIENARLFAEAQAAVHMREEILAVITHDLKSPLSVVRMSAETLAAQHSDHAGITRHAQLMTRACDLMTRMIGDLLDFSSIETGSLKLDLAPELPGRLLADAVGLHQAAAQDKQITLEAVDETTGARVRCDRQRVLQVFSNLLGNAIRFTPEHGTVRVRGRVDGNRVELSVSDTGTGIAQQHLPHVFDRYWQAKRTGRESVGLGLAISKGIIESHGGTIWVESAPGQGATFYFTLPIAKAGNA